MNNYLNNSQNQRQFYRISVTQFMSEKKNLMKQIIHLNRYDIYGYVSGINLILNWKLCKLDTIENLMGFCRSFV